MKKRSHFLGWLIFDAGLMVVGVISFGMAFLQPMFQVPYSLIGAVTIAYGSYGVGKAVRETDEEN